MEELKPCPFCGEAAKSWSTMDDFWCAGRAGCISDRCYVKPIARGTDEEAAIRIWNRRHERTCKFIPEVYYTALDEDGLTEIDTNEMDEDGEYLECSECGYPMCREGWFDEEQGEHGGWVVSKINFNYCPNCGAKVIKGD